MTVLQVMALHPFKLGSFEDYIMEFAKQMDESGHKVVFVFGGEPHPFIKDTLKEHNAKYYVENVAMSTPQAASMIIRIAKIIRQYRVDIVQGQFHPHDHIAVLSAFITGKPAYRTIHTTTSQSPEPLKLTSILRAQLSSYLSITTFAVSNWVKEDLIKMLRISERRIKVLHNGVNLKRYSPEDNDFYLNNELGIGKESNIVLCLSHARPQKGLEYLIKAVPAILKSHPDTYVVFCGGGPLESKLQDLALELGVSSHMHFLGVRDDVQRLLNCADVFVMPSLAEAFGLVLLESMAMEKALVASNVEGIRDIVRDKDTGLLVPPADPESLSDAIGLLLENPNLRSTMGSNGRKRVEELFDLEKRVAAEINIYEEQLKP